MRKIVLLLSFFLASFIALGQSHEHVVKPGETVKSIAEKYGVSEAGLIEANPNLAKFVYVGMKLSIPSVKEEGNVDLGGDSNERESLSSVPVEPKKDDTPSAAISSLSVGGNRPGFKFGTSFMGVFPKVEKQEGFNYTNFGICFSFNGGYFLTDYLFAGAGVGYLYSSSSSSTVRGSDAYDLLGDYSVEVNSHSIYAPVRLGFKSSSFLVYTGPQFIFPLVNKQIDRYGKEKSSKNLSTKEVSVYLPLGVGVGYDDLFLCFEYLVGLKKGSSNAWSIGIRGGF